MTGYNELILADLVESRAAVNPGLDVLTFEGAGVRDDEIRTYRQLWDNGRHIAGALLDTGMSKGDHFALLMQNHPEFIESMVAASITGTVFVPIDPRINKDKLVFLLRDAMCKGIICADYTLEVVIAARSRVPELEWVMVLESEPPLNRDTITRDLIRLREVLNAEAPVLEKSVTDPAETMEILYTSGTTGDPKGIVIPHARFGIAAGHGQAIFGFDKDDRPYTGLSLTHGNAQFVTLGASLKMGLRAVFSRKFTKSRLWDITRQYQCTTFSLLGGMVNAIYSEPLRPDDADNPVRFVVSAGMPALLWEAFERRFDLKIFEFYGAVEGGLTFKRIGEGPVGSIGRPAPGLAVKIIDDEGNECPPGVPGEILFRPEDGSAPVVEYFNNPAASAQKTEGGWLHSGDVVHADEQGWLFYEYRKGGGIRHNGEFINPGFVEKAIAEHPRVTDVYVYGVDSTSGTPGEKAVVAAIVSSNGESFDAQSLFQFCRERLESNFIPAFVQIVEEIPKTVSEKPQDRYLIEMFNEQKHNVHTEEGFNDDS